MNNVNNAASLIVEEDVSTVSDTLKSKITKEQLFKALKNGIFPISKEDTIKAYFSLKDEYKNDIDLILAKLEQLNEDIFLLKDLLSPYQLKEEEKDGFTNRLINYDNYLVQLVDNLFDVMRNSEELKSLAGALRNKLLDSPQYVKARAGKYYSEKKLVDLLREAMKD